MIIIVVFFFWPAGQALVSVVPAAGRLRHQCRPSGSAWRTSQRLFSERPAPTSRRSGPRRSSRCWWPGWASAISLLLAVDGRPRDPGAHGSTSTLLIWPYAVAPAVAGVLWLFMFAPSVGIVSYLRFKPRHRMEPPAQRQPGDDADRDGAAVWKQISYNFLFFLAGLQSIPKSLIEAAAIDGARPLAALLDHRFPLLSPTTFFLLVINIVYAFFDTFAIVDAATQGGPGKDTAILVYKVYYDGFKAHGPRRLVGGAIGGADGDRDRADRRAVPLRREDGATTDGTLVPAVPAWLNAGPWSSPSVRMRRAGARRGWWSAFPLYVTFVASTQTALSTSCSRRCRWCPATTSGTTTSPRCFGTGKGSGAGSGSAPVAPMLLVSLISALVIAARQDRDLDAVGVCDRLLPLPVPQRSSSGWIFITLMLPVEVRIGPTYKVVADLGMLNTYARA